MPGFHHFLRCVGKAVLKQGVRALFGLVPLGEQLYDIASEAISDYRQDCNDAQLHAEIAAVALAGVAEASAEAEAVVEEIAAGQPEDVRTALTTLLTQVPSAVRQSLRRPEDPTGTTIASGRSFGRPEELMRVLPSKLPRFKPGDHPLVGVDLVLEELLGVGGFGEVWKARNPYMTSAPPVALKFCLDATAAQTLQNETAMLNRVMQQGRHPGIVQLHRTYLRSETPCLEYEYVEGGDLVGLIHEWHRPESVASPEKVTAVMSRIAEIVGFAHRLVPPVIHRDLKPANILVHRQASGEPDFKVADFGIGGLAPSRQLSRRISARLQGSSSAPLHAELIHHFTPRQSKCGARPRTPVMMSTHLVSSGITCSLVTSHRQHPPGEVGRHD